MYHNFTFVFLCWFSDHMWGLADLYCLLTVYKLMLLLTATLWSCCVICVLPLPLPEHGFIGYSSWLLGNNSLPDYSPGENFFTVFGVFFPAATGERHHLPSTVSTTYIETLPVLLLLLLLSCCKCSRGVKIWFSLCALCVQGSWQASTWAQTFSGLNITSLWEHWQLSLPRMTPISHSAAAVQKNRKECCRPAVKFPRLWHFSENQKF